MLEISPRLVQRGYAIMFGGGAAAESGKLRKDEPHPVALLMSGAELGNRRVEHAILGVHEALQIVTVLAQAEQGAADRAACPSIQRAGASSPAST